MKPLYRNLAAAALVYVASVAANIGIHYNRYSYSKAASQDTVHHGPNLRWTWDQVAQMHYDDMLSPKVLIPLEAILGARPEEPIMIRRIE